MILTWATSISSMHCLRPKFVASMISACFNEVPAATVFAVAKVTPFVARTKSTAVAFLIESSGCKC